jgi:hypothetical protein
MKPPIESAPAEPTSEVHRLGKQVEPVFEVSSEEASGCDRGGHHLGVTDATLRAFLMAAGLEPIIDETVRGYDSGVHWAGQLRE